MIPRYFQWKHSRSRGDEYDSWGGATYFFETSQEGKVLRELQIFDDGHALKYDAGHSSDVYGQMAHSLGEIEEFVHLEISADVFERAWDSRSANNT